MNYRILGRTGLRVGDVGYGAWGIGGTQWLGGADDESLAALRRAVDLGLNFIDTALAYGDGHSERLVGEVVRSAGTRIYVATKIPPKNQLWPARPGVGIGEVFPYPYILRSTEQSLRNLGLDCIDVQQLHVWNPEWLERDEWRRGMEDLKTSGKARFVGISINDHQPDSALEIVATGLIDTVQVIYNIFDQSPEAHLWEACRKHNLGVIARCPFDEGSLAGSIREDSEFVPTEFRAFYFRGDRKSQVVKHVEALRRDLPAECGTLAEAALRFCLSAPEVSTVIPGMRSRRNVEANCRASDAGPLPESALQALKPHQWSRNFYS